MRSNFLSMFTRVLFVFAFYLISSICISQSFSDKKLERFISKDDYDTAKEYLCYRLKNVKEFKDVQREIYYSAKAGFVYLRLGLLDSAMYYSKKALSRLSPNVTKQLKFETWKSIAYSYCRLGKIDSATFYTHKLYTDVYKTNNFEMQRFANILMGIISFQNKLLFDSLKYYEKALKISRLSKNINNYKVDYYNLGLTHMALKNYQQAIKFLEMAEFFALKGNDKRLLGRIYGTTADSYAAQGNNEKRQFYLEKANAVANMIKDNKLLIMGASHQMQWDFNNGNSKKAFENGSKIVKNLNKERLPQLKAKDDSLMYVMAKKEKNEVQALFYLESFTKNKLKLLKENGRKQIEEIRAKYQLENKNLTIQKQEVEIIASKRINRITYLIIFVFLLVFFFLFYMYFRHKKIVHLIYRKEKEKDSQIIKLKDLIQSYKFINSNKVKIDELKDPVFIKSDSDIKDAINLDNKILDIFEKTMYLLETERLFLNPNLDQNIVVKLIGTNKKYLYEAISKHSDLNFRALINRFRVEEAKRLIESKISVNQEINFSNIFSECGFNSNSSFYRTFKSITGITPNEYATESKKDYKEKK